MIIGKTDGDDDPSTAPLLGATNGAPPPFQLTASSFSDDYSAPGGEPPPPEFTPYEAEFFHTSKDDIVSHDPHLNQDGEALYRFLLSQATTPPTYRLHCRGSHTESRTRWVSRTNTHGRLENHSEHYTETITDFDFSLDIGQYIAHGPVHWSIADAEPAFRGLMVRQIDLENGDRCKATRVEKKTFDTWKKQRSAMGLPPWVSSQTWFSGENHSLKSSRTLRQWADDYCSSPKYLKEFVYEKVIHGWNVEKLKEAVRSTITSSLYQGQVKVDFEISASKIYIRPDNTLSRMLSNTWLKILSIILLIYPFIWLFKRFHSHGGGRWEVCGGAYALKLYEPVPSAPPMYQDHETSHGQSSSQASDTALVLRLVESRHGTNRLIGLREGEWFKQWEGTIRRAVQNKYVSSSPLYHPDGVAVDAALQLDGYRP